MSGIDFFLADAGGRNSEDSGCAYTLLCEECGAEWETDTIEDICEAGHEDVSCVRGVEHE